MRSWQTTKESSSATKYFPSTDDGTFANANFSSAPLLPPPTQQQRANGTMYVKWQPHRFFIRQYLYPILCLILLVFLVKWNSTPKEGTTGAQWHDQSPIAVSAPLEMVLVEPSVDANNVQAEKAEKPIVSSQSTAEVVKSKGNSVELTVFMEAQCPDTTGFIKRQLVPSWEKLGATNRVNVTIVPFGKAKCQPDGEDFKCYCQHGVDECNLNQMMNCAIDQLVVPDRYIPLIGCIQGQDDLDSAHATCLKAHPNEKWIMECARGRRGRYLHALAGQKTSALGDDFNFVPWVVLDGKRVNDAFYALAENLCQRLDEPKPTQCKGV